MRWPFDECIPYPADHDYAKRSTARTHVGRIVAKRLVRLMTVKVCLALFKAACIKTCANKVREELVAMDFEGYSIGGLSVGEPHDLMNEILEYTTPLLPTNQGSLFDGRWYSGLSR